MFYLFVITHNNIIIFIKICYQPPFYLRKYKPERLVCKVARVRYSIYIQNNKINIITKQVNVISKAHTFSFSLKVASRPNFFLAKCTPILFDV